MKRLSILRGFGEALTQFFLVGGIVFLFERLGLFQITVTSWDQNVVWWLSETGVVLVVILLISLSLVNLGFVFVWRPRWWLRALLKSIILVPVYFLVEYLFSPITTFSYSDLYIFGLLLFMPVLASSLVLNRYIPVTQDRTQKMLEIIKRYKRMLED